LAQVIQRSRNLTIIASSSIQFRVLAMAALGETSPIRQVVVTGGADEEGGAVPVSGVVVASAPMWRRALPGAVLMLVGAMVVVATARAGTSGDSGKGSAPQRSLEAEPEPDNPIAGHPMYVNPSYRASLESSITTAEGTVKATLESMRDVPSAYWLDHKGKIAGSGTQSMEGILMDAASKPTPELVTFIIYDLPNRDCHAKASNGEICCTYKADGTCDYTAAGNCEAGLTEYKTEYIDPIVRLLELYHNIVPIVLVIEPDSLPNLSTNSGDFRCGNSATQTAYKSGIAYAVQSIAAVAPTVAIYLDAGHGGWLGWKSNMKDFALTIKSLGVAQHLRGFATNVAGYQHIGKVCPEYDWCLNNAHPEDECCSDPCGLSSQWNPSNNELNYAIHLRKAMSEAIPGFEPHMIIDSGRNGVPDMRAQCKHWCNIRGAGVGLVPTTATADTAVVDAYLWLKTPGESDGCTQKLPDDTTCPRFDTDCASEDSIGSRPGEPRCPGR